MSKQDLIKHKKGEVIKEAQIEGEPVNTGKKLLFTVILLVILVICCIKLFSQKFVVIP